VLGSYLKDKGHKVRVIIGESSNAIIKKLSRSEIAAFSIMTGMHRWALRIASDIKKELNLLTIFGGAHPTYFPEIIKEEAVDIICRGEGEEALLDLANAIDNKQNIENIKNLWVKKEGLIFENQLRPLMENLDLIPFQDREIYYNDYPVLKNNPHKIFIAGRGCPFKCTFCFNEQLREMYKNNGNFIRFRSPLHVIKEIKEVKSKYGIETVFFYDDIFTLNRKWLREFINVYSQDVCLPFYCAGRADILTEEIIKLLKVGGCKGISFAIESGNEEIRNKILGKKITNKQIIEAAAFIKKSGIKFTTFNMIGIPGETIDNAIETIKLNIKIGTAYPRCSFLTPYPGTRIAEYAAKYGYLDSTINTLSASSQQGNSIIKIIDRNKMINLHLFFQTAVILPSLLPLIQYLIKLPSNIIFRIWWAIIYFFVFITSEGRRTRDVLLFAVKSFHSFFEKKQ
jgi:radical SAM superfamily enzyme YgiQ (UPF0313 family)